MSKIEKLAKEFEEDCLKLSPFFDPISSDVNKLIRINHQIYKQWIFGEFAPQLLEMVDTNNPREFIELIAQLHAIAEGEK